MYIAIYYFKTKEGQQDKFETAWAELTKLIYQHRNSLGSRLHKKNDVEYIAYAQWPDKATFYPEQPIEIPGAEKWRTMMREACEDIHTEHELEVVDDLLKREFYAN